MVKEEGLTGLQLYEQREEGDILEGYHIKYIPRFILIDTEGMIINANAKRPVELLHRPFCVLVVFLRATCARNLWT